MRRSHVGSHLIDSLHRLSERLCATAPCEAYQDDLSLHCWFRNFPRHADFGETMWFSRTPFLTASIPFNPSRSILTGCKTALFCFEKQTALSRHHLLQGRIKPALPKKRRTVAKT